MRGKDIPEKYIRIVQDMHKESETMARCIAGTTEPFKVEVGLHEESALSPFLFAIIMDTLTEYQETGSLEHERKFTDARPKTARSEFRYLGSTVQSDGGVEAEISRIQSGWNNWKMAGVMCDRRFPARVKRKIHQTVIQPAML
ncbi:uncharacterized protein LOC125044124 [Penaeus chinensis]|uniref:uncharacterized protein LOC125044124 n=1 Tax=Penaeus chinensis TaxID=139456 RepID=UPI001FB6D041|nr:uncharacterized protein LOC125044124 [Penaeus chinensis]